MSKKKDFFWLSYSDLMTNLFFIMLALFVIVYTKLQAEKRFWQAKGRELDERNAIDSATKNIDTSYFKYDSTYQKHILKIKIGFETGSDDISDIDDSIQNELVDAGRKIYDIIVSTRQNKNLKKYDIKYLLVVEGQASKDDSPKNDALSYKRALALRDLWSKKGIGLDSLEGCEVLMVGSGQAGVPRDMPDKPPKNQRFLITLMPKVRKLPDSP